MTLKERFLNIKTYEEYLKERENLLDLKPDKEVMEHLSKLLGKQYNGKEELYKTKRKLD